MKKLFGLLISALIVFLVNADEVGNVQGLEIFDQVLMQEAIRRGMNDEQIQDFLNQIRQNGEGVPYWFLQGMLEMPDNNRDLLQPFDLPRRHVRDVILPPNLEEDNNGNNEGELVFNLRRLNVNEHLGVRRPLFPENEDHENDGDENEALALPLPENDNMQF